MPGSHAVRPRRRHALVLAALAIVGAGIGPRTAHADTEETERRLKTAGVPPALRLRIHESIARGVAFLVRQQRSNGAFAYPTAENVASYTSGTTALASLALAHSGGPDADAAARKGLEYLAPDDTHVVPSALRQTYAAGLTAMLLRAVRARRTIAARIARSLESSIDPEIGWWGYGFDGPEAAAGLGGVGAADIVNLSTSQYGALGLWAAADEAGGAPSAVWRLHLRALCASQCRDGSWGYGWRPGTSGYPNGTFMGLANLVLAEQALAAHLEDDPVLAARAAVAHRAALRALDRDVAATFRAASIDYYGYFALEKACVFADLGRAGDQNWYVSGAERLVADQLENGGWGGTQSFRAGVGMMTQRTSGDCVSTGFALLFLLRAADTFHPVTPRDVVAPGPVTPGGGPSADGSPSPRPGVAAPPRLIPLAEADAAVAALRAAGDRRERADAALEAIAVIGAALRGIESGAATTDGDPASLLAAQREFLAAVAAWRDRAGKALVAAIDSDAPRVALAAAEALEFGPASVSGDLRAGIDRLVRSATADPPRALVDAAFRAVGAMSAERSLPWLAIHATTGRRPAEVRAARAALRELARWTGGSRSERLTVAARLARTLADLERAAQRAAPDDAAAWAAVTHWDQLGAPAIAALTSLCRDPDAPEGTFPWDAASRPTTVAAFATWIAAASRR